jgi:hypothetical protein
MGFHTQTGPVHRGERCRAHSEWFHNQSTAASSLANLRLFVAVASAHCQLTRLFHRPFVSCRNDLTFLSFVGIVEELPTTSLHRTPPQHPNGPLGVRSLSHERSFLRVQLDVEVNTDGSDHPSSAIRQADHLEFPDASAQLPAALSSASLFTRESLSHARTQRACVRP